MVLTYLRPNIFSIGSDRGCLTRFARSPIITRKMVPICLRASLFPKSMSNNKQEQVQNQYAIALPHLLVSNRLTRIVNV